MIFEFISKQNLAHLIQNSLLEDAYSNLDIIPDFNINSLLKQDVTAHLIPENKNIHVKIISKDPQKIKLCGMPVLINIFEKCVPDFNIINLSQEGSVLSQGECVIEFTGDARNILTAERTALNYLQTLSATATVTMNYVSKISHTQAKLLDTRKTIPNLRALQKYAVKIGGGVNHRVGLYDAFLIKENHILALGGISKAINQARMNHPDIFCEIEVENLDELEQALMSKADRVMLDNFNLEDMRKGVELRNKIANNIPLEVSGDVNLETISNIAEMGVDFISVGGLTKHIQAIDFSLRVV